MKKLFLTLVFGMMLLGGDIGVLAENRLPLQETNYDKIIQRNIIKKQLDISQEKGEGTEIGFRNLFQGKKSKIIFVVNILLGAFAILWLVVLGAKFIIAQGDVEKLTKYKTEFGWIVVGLICISVAEYAGFQILDPTKDILEGSSANNFQGKIHQIKWYIEILIVGIILIKTMMVGYDLITGGEDDEAIEREKGFFQTFFFGAFFILMAEVLVRIFAGENKAGDFVGPKEAVGQAVSEIVGLLNFILSFVGVTALIMLILASLYYVISFGNEDQMNRAKRIIISCIIGIVIVISSYTYMRFLIRLKY